MESLTTAIAVFIASAVVVIIAGVNLARFGDELAEKTGWGHLWVGTILVAVATSLPELTVNISAVAFEDSPGLALGNVFGADMMNVFVMGVVALLFGARNVWATDSTDIPVLMLVGIGLVVLAAVMGASGDFKLGPTSLGGLLIATAYILGMRAVYKAGRTDMDPGNIPGPKGSARNAWIGFGVAALVVIVAARYLAASADSIAGISGISASFIGVLLVSLVTTLPEGSVTVAAAMRKSYGIVVGNVYGSCAFNVFILSVSDLFYTKGPLTAAMGSEHFAAAAAAFAIMSMGYLIMKSFKSPALAWGRGLTPVIPVLYLGALYVVFRLGQQ
jgi:cation:H+ antiporter